MELISGATATAQPLQLARDQIQIGFQLSSLLGLIALHAHELAARRLLLLELVHLEQLGEHRLPLAAGGRRRVRERHCGLPNAINFRARVQVAH